MLLCASAPLLSASPVKRQRTVFNCFMGNPTPYDGWVLPLRTAKRKDGEPTLCRPYADRVGLFKWVQRRRTGVARATAHDVPR